MDIKLRDFATQLPLMNKKLLCSVLFSGLIALQVAAQEKNKIKFGDVSEKDYLHDEFDFATYEISSFDYKETNSSLPAVEESLDIRVSNYATTSGKRLFIVPDVMTRSHRKLSADVEWKYDLELGFEYKDVDTVEIIIPAGYTTESMPQDVSISSRFGKFNCSVRMSGTHLFFCRNMEHYGGRFPAKDYTDLVKSQ